MRKVIVIVISCLVLFGGYRIFSINQNPPIVNYYNIGETTDYRNVTMTFVESRIDTPNEFEEKFDIDLPYSEECQIISICINVTNTSDHDIGWDEIFRIFNDSGFESSVWCSSVDPFISAALNTFNNDCLRKGESQDIYFMTPIERGAFTNSSWEKLHDYKYYFVISLNPEKESVRLEI